jgi:hypothetical protein
MGEKRNEYRLSVGKPQGKRPLGRPRRIWVHNIKMELGEVVYKTENTAEGIRHADHVAPSIRKSWQSLRRQAAVARSV